MGTSAPPALANNGVISVKLQSSLHAAWSTRLFPPSSHPLLRGLLRRAAPQRDARGTWPGLQARPRCWALGMLGHGGCGARRSRSKPCLQLLFHCSSQAGHVVRLCTQRRTPRGPSLSRLQPPQPAARRHQAAHAVRELGGLRGEVRARVVPGAASGQRLPVPDIRGKRLPAPGLQNGDPVLRLCQAGLGLASPSGLQGAESVAARPARRHA